MGFTDEVNLILIGRLGKPVGLKGHFNLIAHSDNPSGFSKYKEFFVEKSRKYFDLNYLSKDNNIVTTTIEGRFLADGISSDLFVINRLVGSLKDQ